MASVWISILVIISVGNVLAERNCSVELIKNCDECIRCGATWCLDPSESQRCVLDTGDSWCPGQRLQLSGTDTEEDYEEAAHKTERKKFASINTQNQVEIFYDNLNSKKNHFEIGYVNSSIPGYNSSSGFFKVSVRPGEKTLIVEGTPNPDFCPADGRTAENLTVIVIDNMWNNKIVSTVTFEIPCACNCSSKVERNSKKCSGRGNYSCNACSCEEGWMGNSCEEKEKHCDRGDIGGCVNQYTGKTCSDNGICRCDGRCICDKTIEGSQYFDHQCTDICMSTSFCDSCLMNPNEGSRCKDCEHIYIDTRNKTRLNERDEYNRTVWVNCNETNDECMIQYVAMKDSYGKIHVMILEPCNAIPVPGGVALKVTVPAVLGVLACTAAAAAVAGYMVWKRRAPPLPLKDSAYTNIDAEDCTGINPLYISPTSSFKNPTYGKVQ